MPFIEWNDTFSVGIEEIDNQHKKLIELINQLHEAVKDRKTAEVLDGILNELAEYTVYHFKTEEDYFEEFNYPETELHKKEHGMFVAKVIGYIDDNKTGKLLISLKVLNFLSYWLINHIGESDQKYVSLFSENGVK